MEKFSFAIILLLISNSTFAAFRSATSRSTGNAGVAVSESSDSPFMNPATLPHLRGYYFNTSYSTTTNTRDFGVALTDNLKETIVPTSLAYQQSRFEEAGSTPYNERNMRLSVGNFVGGQFSAGLGINFNDNELLDRRYQQTNLNFGVLWAVNRALGVGYYIENSMPGNKDIPEVVRQRQSSSIGLTYNFQKFVRARFDVGSGRDNRWGQPTTMGGVEYYLNKWMIAKVGALRNEEFKKNIYSGGIGFIGPKFGLHYAFQNESETASGDRHAVDLMLPLW